MKALRVTRENTCRRQNRMQAKKQELKFAETILQHCISHPSYSSVELNEKDPGLEQRLAQLENENMRLKERLIELTQENKALLWIVEKRNG